jgi:hypothetical protein
MTPEDKSAQPDKAAEAKKIALALAERQAEQGRAKFAPWAERGPVAFSEAMEQYREAVSLMVAWAPRNGEGFADWLQRLLTSLTDWFGELRTARVKWEAKVEAGGRASKPGRTSTL